MTRSLLGLAIRHLAQRVERIDEGLGLADGAEVAVLLLGDGELVKRQVGGVNDPGELAANGGERREGRGDERRDEAARSSSNPPRSSASDPAQSRKRAKGR
ncbi:MAG: hypothetical protein U0359_14175 [Byssovorax sp.]